MDIWNPEEYIIERFYRENLKLNYATTQEIIRHTYHKYKDKIPTAPIQYEIRNWLKKILIKYIKNLIAEGVLDEDNLLKHIKLNYFVIREDVIKRERKRLQRLKEGLIEKRGWSEKNMQTEIECIKKELQFEVEKNRKLNYYLEKRKSYLKKETDKLDKLKFNLGLSETKQHNIKRLKDISESNKLFNIGGKNERRCKRCKKLLRGSDHHIIPRNYDGGDNPENQIFLCFKCHDKVEIWTDELLKQRPYSVDMLRTFVMNQFPNENS